MGDIKENIVRENIVRENIGGGFYVYKCESGAFTQPPPPADKNESTPVSRTAVLRNGRNIKKYAFITQPKENILGTKVVPAFLAVAAALVKDVNVVAVLNLITMDTNNTTVVENPVQQGQVTEVVKNQIIKAVNSIAVNTRINVTLRDAVPGMTAADDGVWERGEVNVLSLTKRQMLKHLREDTKNVLIKHYASQLDADEVAAAFEGASVVITPHEYCEGEVINGIAAKNDGFTYDLSDIELSKPGFEQLVLAVELKKVSNVDTDAWVIGVADAQEKAAKLAAKLYK